MTSLMLENWQTAAALACVAAAVAYLVRRLRRALRAPCASACSSCAHSTIAGVKHKPLVTLDAASALRGERPR